MKRGSVPGPDPQYTQTVLMLFIGCDVALQCDAVKTPDAGVKPAKVSS
jgi:hypothetical protein